MADPEAIAAAVQAALQAILPQLQQAPPAPAAPAAPVAPMFALSPATAVANIIDYSTKAGTEVYTTNTAELKTVFSIEKPNITVFLNELKTRSTEAKWNDPNIFDIPVGNTTKNLLTEFGQATIEQCINHTHTYLGQHTRTAQNNYQLYVCLSKTLDADSKSILEQDEECYMHNGTYDGVTFLKLILNKVSASTRATASVVRAKLSRLKEYIKEDAAEDVAMFNVYVKTQVRTLRSVGQESTDLLENIFSAYLSVSNPKFCHAIQAIRNAYDDGQEDTTPSSLMKKGESHFRILTTRGEWEDKSPQEEHIIALEAQVKELKIKVNKSESRKPDTQGPTTPNKNRSKTRTHSGKWAWRNTPPKDGEAHTKEFSDSTWKYCSIHGWCKHLTADCRDGKNKDTPTADAIDASLARVGINDIQESWLLDHEHAST